MILRKILTAVLAGVGMMILILDSQTALSGACAGIELCLKTVVPSLFPFLFLCSVLTESLWGASFPLLQPLCAGLGFPKGAESILISALLGGYPAGAKAIGESYRDSRISREDAAHLLSFCSNAGPAFLFGMTLRQFEHADMVWAMWAIQITAAFLTGISSQYRPQNKTRLPGKTLDISQVLVRTVRTIGSICGWILLFRILSEFLNLWFFWRFSPEIRVILTGMLELSNGCLSLRTVANPFFRFLICSSLLSFGGLCIVMQTASVIGGLSLKFYLTGKILQTFYTLLLAIIYWYFHWIGLLSAGMIAVFALSVRKKAVDFRKEPVYNADITPGRKHHHAVS